MVGWSSTTVTISVPALSQPPPEPEHRDEPVLGYRAWSVDRMGYLHALAYPEYIWAPGEDLHAGCMSWAIEAVNGGHHPPEWHCGCGFWSLFDLDHLQERYLHQAQDAPRLVTKTGTELSRPVIGGACWAWGNLVQHAVEGYRAEWTRPIALLDFVDPRYPHKLSFKERGELAARRYKIPFLKRENFLRFATEFGSKLPD